MKKILYCLLAFAVLALCACTPKIPPAAEPTNLLGITLTVEELSPTGCILVCEQEGGEVKGELQTGEDYILERFESGKWVAVDTVIEEYGWNSIAWLIQPGRNEFPVDWEWLYGSLPAGQYRIGKSFMDFIEAGNYENTMVYAQFKLD